MATILTITCIILIKTAQSLSSCIESNVPVTNFPLSNLTDNGWTRCLFTSMQDPTGIRDLITDCPNGDDYYLFIGGTRAANSTEALLGAFAPSEVFINFSMFISDNLTCFCLLIYVHLEKVTTIFTDSIETAYIPPSVENTAYNVYWYNLPPTNVLRQSFGFAPTSSIEIGYASGQEGDISQLTDPLRFSISFEGTIGGYRIGANVNLRYALDSYWYKIIYYKHCNDSTPTSIDPPSDPCKMENNIQYQYHVGNLEANGWERCYFQHHSETMTTDDIMTSCEMGDDIRLFVGTLPTIYSTSFLIGAYGPSSVLSTVTSSTTTAEIPPLLQGTGYNVYWYNYYNMAFGFSPSATISISGSSGDTVDSASTGVTFRNRMSWAAGVSYGGQRAVCMNI